MIPTAARTGLVVAATTMAALAGRYTLARRAQDRQTAGELDLRLTDLGTVERATVLPLVERHTGKPGLRGEAGVSYLVTAGDTTILFDTGLGTGGGPTALESNAHALGISWDDLDALVISHLHLDHVGGPTAQLRHTFRIGPHTELPRSLPAYLPTAMTHPLADVRVTDHTRVIAPGVAVLPPLPRTLFWLGPVVEQALIVNVRDRGLVLITGCGHPPIEHTLAAAEHVVQAPVHAVIGGLHLPVHPGGTPLLPQRCWATRTGRGDRSTRPTPMPSSRPSVNADRAWSPSPVTTAPPGPSTASPTRWGTPIGRSASGRQSPSKPLCRPDRPRGHRSTVHFRVDPAGDRSGRHRDRSSVPAAAGCARPLTGTGLSAAGCRPRSRVLRLDPRAVVGGEDGENGSR